MITLTIGVPNPQQIINEGYPYVQVQKSPGSPNGTFAAVGSLITLDPNTTSYSWTDINGSYGDWYATAFMEANQVVVTSRSAAQPGYLSDLCGNIRDLLGVTTTEISDAQVQDFAFLPTGLARIRGRLSTFDALVAAGGDPATLCLAALAHLTAALMCPRMTVMVVDSEQFDKYRYQRNRQMDWTATQSQLLAEYEILISQAAGEDASINSPVTYVAPVLMAGPTASGAATSILAPATDNGLAESNPLVPYTPIPYDPNLP